MSVVRAIRDGDPVSGDRAGASSTNPNRPEPVELRSNAKYPLLVDPQHKQAAEYFGILRTRLLNARAKSGLGSVLVTSAQKQEGKSLICINLAISLAQLNRDRILLVDGDLRMKGLSSVLELEQAPGLSDFLQDRTSFEACVRATSLSHLSVVSAGEIAEELVPAALEGPRWVEFLDLAKRDFGLIVVDSVPITAPIADFELLLAGCDSALLVVQLRRAKWEALEVASARMNGKLLGIIVNNSEPSDLDHYSYGRGKRKPAAKTKHS
jgi:capsular exopolysaccharide synthesis family protein